MSEEMLCPGHAVVFEPGDHAHTLGGKTDLVGSECPNCQKSLMLYMTLDLKDTRLKLSDLEIESLPLLYCFRCNIMESTLAYHLVSEGTIELVAAAEGDNGYGQEWAEEFGIDMFPSINVSLEPLSEKVGRLQAMLGEFPEEEPTDDDVREYLQLTSRYVGRNTEQGGRPCVFSQVGGLPFLPQFTGVAACNYCERLGQKRHPRLLAVLCNNTGQNYKIAPEFVHVIFWFCTSCRTMAVKHAVG